MDRRKTFLERCRHIAATRGERQNYHGNACVRGGAPAYVFKDPTITIVTAIYSQAMDIEMHRPHDNPVIMIKEDGDSLRFHGEWTMLEDYVAGLVILDELAKS